MKLSWICGIGLALLVAFPVIRADGPQDNIPENVRRIPAEGIAVPADREAKMRSALTGLQQKIAQIRSLNRADLTVLLPDIMIFERAVRCALDYNEFFDAKEFDRADDLLGEGHKRADELLAGSAAWPQRRGLTVRGYISRIDQTVQPYGLVIPPTYDLDHSVPTRCDLWFHGRGEKLSEVNFIWERLHNPGEFTPDHTIVLHPYGRYCNAFKFAGEIDVLEALEDVQSRYRIDEDRISVRGFSMGALPAGSLPLITPIAGLLPTPGRDFQKLHSFSKCFKKKICSRCRGNGRCGICMTATNGRSICPIARRLPTAVKTIHRSRLRMSWSRLWQRTGFVCGM